MHIVQEDKGPYVYGFSVDKEVMKWSSVCITSSVGPRSQHMNYWLKKVMPSFTQIGLLLVNLPWCRQIIGLKGA
jgi:hypothetical protein